MLVVVIGVPVGALPPPPDEDPLAKPRREGYVDYLRSVTASKRASGTLDRILGVSGATRNRNTLLKLIDATA